MKVNEIFGPTIQGEGKSVGISVMFLRLSTCNLHCIWCDTPYTWNWVGSPFAHSEKFEYSKEVHEMTDDEIVAQLEQLNGDSVKSLVISGGEPLIQQKQLISLIRILKGKGWWIEVETNGTVLPTPEMFEAVDQFNCSPKLSNSGDREALRIRPLALTALVRSPKVFFKFVIATQADIDEVLEYVHTFNMSQVYLMPLGKTREELLQTREATLDLCARYGFSFSDRLHVIEFGGIRAV